MQLFTHFEPFPGIHPCFVKRNQWALKKKTLKSLKMVPIYSIFKINTLVFYLSLLELQSF